MTLFMCILTGLLMAVVAYIYGPSVPVWALCKMLDVQSYLIMNAPSWAARAWARMVIAYCKMMVGV